MPLAGRQLCLLTVDASREWLVQNLRCFPLSTEGPRLSILARAEVTQREMFARAFPSEIHNPSLPDRVLPGTTVWAPPMEV